MIFIMSEIINVEAFPGHLLSEEADESFAKVAAPKKAIKLFLMWRQDCFCFQSQSVWKN